MNYIRHLTGFFDKIQHDDRLNPTHISLYLALFQFWNLNHFKNPISISRNEMMKLSKISAYGTYHKCIKQLQEFGYILYEPSFNPFKGSMVYLYNFDEQAVQITHGRHIKKTTAPEQELNNIHIKTSTGLEQALTPSINNINLLNKKHIVGSNHENISSALKEKKYGETSDIYSGTKIPPTFSEVKFYFEEKDFPFEQAEKFFNYYESNGWMAGGKTKMRNWQAAARNWMLNSRKFETKTNPCEDLSEKQTLKTNYLHATTNKSYRDEL